MPSKTAKRVSTVRIAKEEFLKDRQGKTFSDVASDEKQPFHKVLEFFQDSARQQRMEDSELHHDRAPLAGGVRELEAQPEIDCFLVWAQNRRNTRFRQAIGVLIRMIMERRGWKKTGRKGSLGVRGTGILGRSAHNTGASRSGLSGRRGTNLRKACPIAPSGNVVSR